MSRISHILFFSLAAVLFLHSEAWGAEPNACALSPMPPQTSSNMFSDEQEMVLGDQLGAMIEDDLDSIEVPELTRYLEVIGARLVQHLPSRRLKYRFFLSDRPEQNAFSIVGGRVYVTRKLIASARNEDEVAGVIGHELGHIVTHQQAIEFTDYFKQVGITSVTTQKDVEEKFHRFLEKRYTLRYGGKHGENEQRVADRVGMESVVRAGYAAEAYADFYDRVTENKKKRGSWISDLVGSTKPEARRYREMLKLAPKLPTGCVDARPADAAEQFKSWQKKVVEYRGSGRAEKVHAVMLKRQIDPPLQDDLKTLRFSPDGAYLLAQNSGTVYVLRREPLEYLFQFEATSAYAAQFTADSKQVLVYDHNMRVERWDIAGRQRVDIDEVSSRAGCRQLSLSPDGTLMACLDGESVLTLINTDSGERVVEYKDFGDYNFGVLSQIVERVLRSGIDYINMSFSPDGRYFVASGSSKRVVYDIPAKHDVPIGSDVKDLLKRDFAFLGPDRLVAVMGQHGEKSRVVRFPGGELLQEINTGMASVQGPAHGDYVLLRPVEGFAVGVLDIKQNKVIRANRRRAFDVYDNTFASEMGNGELGLFRDSATPVAKLTLPRGRLGRLEDVSVSPDFRWIALSGRTHAGVWNVARGARLYDLKGFQSGYFAPDDSLLVDFPKQGTTPRSIVRLGLDQQGMTLAQTVTEEQVTQHGPYLTVLRPLETVKLATKLAKMKEEDEAHPTQEVPEADYEDVLQRHHNKVALDIKDVRTGQLLWSRRFEKEMPTIDLSTVSGTMVLEWRSDDEGLRDSLRNAPDRQLLGTKDGDYLLEVVEAGTGKTLGRLPIHTNEGSYNLYWAYAAGDAVFVEDSLDRVSVYSLKTRQLSGRMFGSVVSFTPDGKRVCVQHQRGRIVVYDTATLAPLDEFAFTTSVRTARFNGSQLFVLTADQTAYILQVKE